MATAMKLRSSLLDPAVIFSGTFAGTGRLEREQSLLRLLVIGAKVGECGSGAFCCLLLLGRR